MTYVVRQSVEKGFITKCGRVLLQVCAFGITNCESLLLQSAFGITKCDRLYCKGRQELQSVTVITKGDITMSSSY